MPMNVGFGFLTITFTADIAGPYYGTVLDDLFGGWSVGANYSGSGQATFSAGAFGFFGAVPSSLNFQLGEGLPGTITITKATINGVDITAHFNKLILNDADRTATINVAAIPAYVFGRTEPDPVVEFGAPDITGTSGNDVIKVAVDTRTIVDGGAGNDFITGGAGDDALMGNVGHDTLFGGAGNDVLLGGDDNDVINGGDGDDLIYGGLGDDLLMGGKGNDVLNGGAGKDALMGGAGDDVLYGEDGDDTLLGEAGNDLLSGGAGNDVLLGGAGTDIITGGTGDDYISGGAGDDFLFGEEGDDIIEGGAGNDSIDGGSGADIVTGATGNDVIAGGDNDDILWGENGNDTISGGNDRDSILGDGADILNGDADADIIYGSSFTLAEVSSLLLTPGNEHVIFSMVTGSFYKVINSAVDYATASAAASAAMLGGVAGHLATITSDVENALIWSLAQNVAGGNVWPGATGASSLYSWAGGVESGILFSSGTTAQGGMYTNWTGAPGSSASVILSSGNGTWQTASGAGSNYYIIEWDGISFSDDGAADTITGGTGEDVLYGGDGNDIIDGDDGRDIIFAGAGNDVARGGTGNDTITGGAGADTMIGGAGNDVFNLADGDWASRETIDGGADNDTILLTNATTVDFTTGTLTSVETLTGSGSNDTVTMSTSQWTGFTAIDLAGGRGGRSESYGIGDRGHIRQQRADGYKYGASFPDRRRRRGHGDGLGAPVEPVYGRRPCRQRQRYSESPGIRNGEYIVWQCGDALQYGIGYADWQHRRRHADHDGSAV